MAIPLWNKLRDAGCTSPGRILQQTGLQPAFGESVNLSKLLQALGVRTFTLPTTQGFYSTALGSTTRFDTVRAQIGVWGSGITIERRRFTVAHSLGHIMLHPLNKTYCEGESPPEGEDPLFHAEANNFAAKLLMPGISVSSYIDLFAAHDFLGMYTTIAREMLVAEHTVKIRVHRYLKGDF